MTARRRNRVRVLAVAAIAAALGAGCDGLGEPTVLSVGSHSFTARDLRGIHARMDASQRLTLATREERAEFAEAIVERTLLEDYGEQLIASGQANIDPELRAAREDVLIRRLRTLDGSNGVLDSATVRLAYERMGTTYFVRTLLFSSESQASAARARLATGTGLDALPEYERSGFESWISWSPLPDPVADLLSGRSPGEVLGPVLSRGRWLLIEIVETSPVQLEPYAAMRPRILRGLKARDETKVADALVERLAAETGLRIDDAVIRMLARRTSDAILREGATEGDEDWAVPRLGEDEGETVAAQWSTGRLTAADYAATVARIPRGQRPRSAGLERAIRVIVQESAERRLLAAEASRRGLERDRWVERALEGDRSDRLVRLAAQQIERETAHAGVQDVVRTLRETQPQLFRRDARARVLRFQFPTRELAERELAAIRKAGGGLQRLRELLSSPHPTPGNYHLLELDRSAIAEAPLQSAIFDGPLGEPTGPLEVLGIWTVVVCLEITPSRELTEDEIGTTGFAAAHGTSAVHDWVRRRRDEVGVSVDHDALAAIGPGG